MKPFLYTAVAAAALLSGCQSVTESSRHHAEPAPVSAVPSRPAAQLQQLWMEGVMRDTAPLPVAAVHSDSDRVTLSWNGDAVELLSALARARGLAFSYAGIRLPLPVDIEVQDMTYANLLRLIEMQTAWRATIVTYPGQMVLQFMPSLPAGPVRHPQGGRR
nr:DotD/TraH family lipoprotein [Erwinia amylovora]